MPVRRNTRFAAILLSRQPSRPCGGDLWVQQTQSAMLWLKNAGYGVISSVGMQTWELITAMASIHKIPLRLVIPDSSKTSFQNITDELIRQFDLSPTDTDFISLRLQGRPAKYQIQSARDQKIINLADLILPVSIRSDGSMTGLLEAASSAGNNIDHRFLIRYQRRHEKLAYTLDKTRLSDQIKQCGNEYIIHWTRAANGPAPEERAVDYYRDILRADKYPRSAFDTLRRIIVTGRLIASPRHMPKNTPVVAFCALSPLDVIPLMRWRARFGEMSFEPYGIGIRREVAKLIGIRPVQYGDKLQNENTKADLWLCQSHGTKTDWRQEKEYRHLDDFDFSAIPKDDLIVFCLTPQEGAVISEEFNLRVASFY